eukprot:10071455-Prorocentrum_lima.AAC.1
MTSSLVGSEDVYKRQLKLLVSSSRTSAGNSVFTLSRVFCRVLALDAVSYTHLTLPTICSV